MSSRRVFSFDRLFRFLSFFSILPRLRRLPAKNFSILIVDKVGSDRISQTIPADQSFWVLSVRNEARFINLKMVYHFCCDFKLVLSSQINMLGLYVLSVSKTINAKVLITSIDNCSWDKNLHRVSDLRVLCIQNGIRPKSALQQKTYDLFLTLCERDANLVRERSISATPVGSLNLALAQKARLDSMPLADDHLDLFFISQYREEFWNSNKDQDKRHVQSVKTTLRWISTIASENNLSVGIGFSAKGQNRETVFSQEKNIYDQYLNIPYKIFRREGFHRRGIDCSYGGLFVSKVIIAFSSSMVLEAIGLGKPVVMTTRLLGDIESEHYDWFPQDEFDYFLIKPLFQDFEEKILCALNRTSEEKPPINPNYFCATPSKIGTIGEIEKQILDALN